MYRIIFYFLIFTFISFSVYAQNKNYIKHTVVKGETISQIATKYKVTPYNIYELNPDFQAGVKENDVVLIPTSYTNEKYSDTPKPNTAKIIHTAKAKETLYSISRDYHVDVEDLKVLNADVVQNGLKIGQAIEIPNPNNIHAPVVKEPVKAANIVVSPNMDKTIFHIVESKETKFGIAKKYGITVQELEQRNPAIVANLLVGYNLVISGSRLKTEIAKEVEKPKPIVKEIITHEPLETEILLTGKKNSNGFANYEVKPKETLFSLSQMFNIGQEELIALNPSLKDGVQIGMILKVPGKGSMQMVSNGSSGKYADLSKSIKKTDRKKLVLLLPFNAAKIQGDSLQSLTARLKKDAFLNMTLDFYSGALMAIDSAKTLGLNVDVRIFDSQESKMSSNVADVVANNNIIESDAVIGPFYQQYVEKVAELLKANNVPVISPLSKELGKSYSNLYQAMPSSDYTKSAMFDFMISKEGNIIVVSDPKRIANKEFISRKYPFAKFVLLTENGALDVINLKSLLVKGKPNYVVLDSERTGMILGTTNALLNEIVNFQIQLVIIEPNETLDFEEISMKRLTILKMLYPSLTRENSSSEATVFMKEFKERNKIFPSQFATRGFDITFDTLLRLSQGKSFETSANEDRTEQVESKFEYSRKDSEGYFNKGVYIMEYQEDLSVKQVN